jgi:MerR family transcriptional regulator, light-induced transcriptional regulator
VAVYSIRDLEKLCGIKAHTIRIWEQRYGIIKPNRTETNIRYYLDTDLNLLLNIVVLNRNGHKISKIAKMSKEEIAEKVSAISEVSLDFGTQLDDLTLAMIEMDEYKFDHILTANIENLGFEKTMVQVIYPFLDKLSVFWLTGSINPIQENFISNLIRQKIIAAIDKEPVRKGTNVKKFLIYLPEGENQELSLLFVHYLLKTRGKRVIYLGQNIAMEDLIDACNIHKPDFIFTMISESFAKHPVQKYIDELSASFSYSQILLSGYQVVSQNVQSINNVIVLSSLDKMISFLNGIR